MGIQYLKGDATEPVGDGVKFIAHIVNNRGGFGKGFSGALSAKWPHVEDEYRAWAKNATRTPFMLGRNQYVHINTDLCVVNMLAQDGYATRSNPVVVDYGFLRDCLHNLRFSVAGWYGSVHMPRIGAGLGGGSWSVIERIIDEELCQKRIPVFVYDL